MVMGTLKEALCCVLLVESTYSCSYCSFSTLMVKQLKQHALKVHGHVMAVSKHHIDLPAAFSSGNNARQTESQSEGAAESDGKLLVAISGVSKSYLVILNAFKLFTSRVERHTKQRQHSAIHKPLHEFAFKFCNDHQERTQQSWFLREPSKTKTLQ